MHQFFLDADQEEIYELLSWELPGVKKRRTPLFRLARPAPALAPLPRRLS
jgi:hypothetical protein